MNRYIAALSTMLTYACRELRWINDNLFLNLVKLKEPQGRSRVLFEGEMNRLFVPSKESRSPYLFPIILMALTTGMRPEAHLNEFELL